MIRAKSNLAPFNRAMNKAKANMVPIAMAHGLKMAGHVTDFIGRNAPEDTNKFRRGAILAGRDIGVGTLPLPPLKASRYADKLKSVLIRQMIWMRRAIERLEAREREILAGQAAKRAKKTDAMAARNRRILEGKSKTGARTRNAIQRMTARQFTGKRVSVRKKR